MAKDDIIISDFLEDEELEYGTKEYWEREKENEKKREQYFGDEIEELGPWIDPLAPSLDTTSDFGEITDESGDVITTDLTDDSWWLSDLLTEYGPPAMDWVGEKIKNIPEALRNIDIDREDVMNVSGDILRSQVNALAGVPELLANMYKLPLTGATKFAEGDLEGMAMAPLEVFETGDPLKYKSDDPYGLLDMAEYPAAIWGAGKAHNWAYQRLPDKAKSIVKNVYPFMTNWFSGLGKDIEEAYRRKGEKVKALRKPLWEGVKKGAWPAIRGYGQYGLASTGIGALISSGLYAATPSAGAGESELAFERENTMRMNQDRQRENMMRNFEAANTRAVAPAPSNRAMMEMANRRGSPQEGWGMSVEFPNTGQISDRYALD
mgnify:CR=1 FL=1